MATTDESRFWGALYWWRLAAEMGASGREDLDGWWSDGIYPERYALDTDPPHIDGHVYLGTDVDIKWPFRLILGGRPPPTTREAIDWEVLLPPLGVTGWLAIDRAAKFVTIDLRIGNTSEQDLVLRESYRPTIVARDAPTPEADIVSGDARRTPKTTVHLTAPEPDPRSRVGAWDSFTATSEESDESPRTRFWHSLEHRIGLEIHYAGRPELTNLQPDGIVVDAYEVSSIPPRIEGRCWFKRRRYWSRSRRRRDRTGDASLGPYRFVIALDSLPRAAAPNDLDYDALLPAREHTGWLTFDQEARIVAVDPAVREESDEDILVTLENHFWVIPQGANPSELTSDPDWRRTTPHPRTRVHTTAEPWAAWGTV